MLKKDDAIAEMFDLAARLEVHAQWLGFIRMDQASRDMVLAADHVKDLAEILGTNTVAEGNKC